MQIILSKMFEITKVKLPKYLKCQSYCEFGNYIVDSKMPCFVATFDI